MKISVLNFTDCCGFYCPALKTELSSDILCPHRTRSRVRMEGYRQKARIHVSKCVKVQKCNNARTQERKNTGMQKCKDRKMQGCRNVGMQEC